MKVVEKRLPKRFHCRQVEREEEELRFHLDQLTEEHLQQDIKDQCVGLTGQQNPLTRALKSFLVVVFLLGVLVRVFATEVPATHLGETLMLVAASGRMLLYVRGLNPLNFGSKIDGSSALKLNERAQASASADRRQLTPLTPVERLISDD